jgi:23S rRNA pseudouridine2605 synthase
MTDRREANRDTPTPSDLGEGERIAKYLARAGIASRREVERMIEAGDVRVDGVVLRSPAFKVTGKERIEVDGHRVRAPQATRLFLYHKPAGLITTNSDPDGRRTIFDELPQSLPRVVTVGRLDLTTEGLLLLTNDGELARTLELPSTGLERTYRVRAHGQVTSEKIERLMRGITVDGITYKSIKAVLDRETGSNVWLSVTLTEGKNREVRIALEAVGLMVNRLIRTQYGPFDLGAMKPGAVLEVDPADFAAFLGNAPPNERAAKSSLGAPLGDARLPNDKPTKGQRPFRR